MISLVVCSINPQYLKSLIENVDSNIGIAHEWLVWDNRKESIGLCEVYNRMAEQATFPFICFLHEDVLIKTKDWGKLLIDICEKQGASLVGVAGGKYKSHLFSGWYSGGKEMDYYSIIHRLNGKDEKISGPEKWQEPEVDVACIDGVLMFSTKEAWKTNRFNDDLLKGFHYYDIDFSVRVAKNEKVLVTNRLDIIHLTVGGDFSDKWVQQTMLWHSNMKSILPYSVAKIPDTRIDEKVAKYWLDWLKNMPISLTYKFKWINLQKLYMKPALWYSILKFLIYKPFGLQKVHYFIKGKNLHE